MTAPSTALNLINQLATQTSVQLPDAVLTILDRYRTDRAALADLGDVRSADPAPAGDAVAAAIVSGKNPLTDRSVSSALTKYMIAQFVATSAGNALASRAHNEIRDHEDEVLEVLNNRFLDLIGKLEDSRRVFPGQEYGVVIAGAVTNIIGQGGAALSARMQWDETISSISMVGKLHGAIFDQPGHLRWPQLGVPSGALRQTLIEHDEWVQQRDDGKGLLYWSLLSSESFKWSLVGPAEAEQRSAEIVKERAAWMANQPQHGHSSNRPVIVQL